MGATELTDLEVDRVDAVDRPATRRKFLIVKSEDGKPAEGAAAAAPASGDPAAAAGEAKALLGAVTKAVTTLRADKSAAALSADTIGAFNELIDAIGDAALAKFEAAKSEDKPAEKPAEGETAKAAPLDEDRLAEKIAKGVVAGITAAAAADAGAGTAPASAQPAGQEPVSKSAARKMGDGLFSNIVNGRN